MVPPEGADRDTYVATVAQVLIPSSDTKGEGEYFVDKGRDALTGMIHMLLARVNDRLSDDPRRYEGMPEQWVGKEASLPMLVDWWAHALYDVGNEPEPPGGFDNERAPATKDTLGAWIRTLCDEINPETRNPDSDGLKRGTTARGFGSLSQLVNMADRERSGVIGTMDKSLLPFKNAAVKERTESSDFTPDDLRGIQDENGEWKPVTLYICVNQAEAAAFATLTALLYELLSRSLLSYGPNSFNPRTRRQLGPFAVGFMMDEFAKLPRIPAVLEGPDIGRSMGVFYALISQDYGQIEKKYSAADVRVINTVTSVKHILPQNEPTTIKAIIEMVGKTTIRRGAHSFSEGMGKNIETFKWNRSDTMEETDFLRQEEVAAMKTGTHIVLVQGFMNRPMHLNTPLFFEDPAIAKKVWSRGKGPVATETLPRHIGAAKIAAWNKANDDRGRKAKKNYEAVSEMSLATGESVAELS
jgi:type IV secretion system protein VirD4